MATPNGRFDDRIAELIQATGGGKLHGKVVVDQVYAAYQHEVMGLRHPEGGGPKYLTRALLNNLDSGMRRLSDSLLNMRLKNTMIDIVEDISDGVYDLAPWEFGDLRASGHPSVKDGGKMFYDRPPNVKRLNKSELRAKAELRSLGLGHN